METPRGSQRTAGTPAIRPTTEPPLASGSGVGACARTRAGTRARATRARPETELLEARAELVDRASHDRGEDPKVVAANREQTTVEVLPFELDGRRVAGQDLRVGIVELVQAHEVDGE